MNRFRLFVLSAAVIALPVWPVDTVAGGEGRTEVGPGAVWKADPQFTDTVHAGCDTQSYPRLGECLVEAMREGGASSEAIRFAGSTGNEAWLRAYRETGKVDIAYVTYPFRANENQGVLLVNGDPSPVDVDGAGTPAESELKNDLVYRKLAERYPAISIWPGDRFGTETPVVEPLAGGRSRFHVGYVLRNGCRACEEIGSALFAFDFDRDGRFLGKRLMMVVDTTKGGFSDPAAPVRVEAGKELSIVLESNPSTGYRWGMGGAIDERTVRFLGKRFRPAVPGLMGSAGTEVWTFKAVGKGSAVVVLRYARPWEKGSEPLRQAAFVILVR